MTTEAVYRCKQCHRRITEAVYRCKQCHRRITEGEYENNVCRDCGEVGVYVEYHQVFYGDDEE